MKRIIKIIILLLGVTQGQVFSQESLPTLSISTPVNTIPKLSMFSANAAGSTLSERHNAAVQTPRISSYVLRQMLLPDYYTTSFGFFCKKELQLEKATKIPLRFRLGSLDYCNKLEGKRPFNSLSN